MKENTQLHYEKEYKFFKNLAKRFQIPVHEMNPTTLDSMYDDAVLRLMSNKEEEKIRLSQLIEQCEEGQILHIKNEEDNIGGLILTLPAKKEKRVVLLGPFVKKDYPKAYGMMAELATVMWGKAPDVESYRFTMKKMHPLIEKVIEYIEQDVRQDHTLKQMAKKMNVSPGHLSKLFRQETGMTLTDYVNRKKIAYGVYLLTTTDEKVTSIAYMCGIRDNNYFSRLFKRYNGVSPAEYRMKK